MTGKPVYAPPGKAERSNLSVVAGDTYTARIFVCGEAADLRRLCRDFCTERSLCVRVVPVSYLYTGGSQEGFEVTLINYPRFPTTPEALREEALRLAFELVHGLAQQSATVEFPDGTLYVHRPLPGKDQS
jgi:hypothetical protein